MKNIQIIICLSILLTLGKVFGQTAAEFEMIKSMEWRQLGPFRGGRSCAITGIPNKTSTFIMGTTGGGVWKTINAGAQWENISDGFFGGSIGAVEVSVADPNIYWVGEGEETIRGNVSPGRGIWKSEDAGKSWKSMGLTNTRHIVRIRTHPKNPDIVLVAALGNVFKSTPDRGIFKTIDGGRNWKKVLFVNDSAGAIDVLFDPNNSRIVYAATWNMRRNAYQMSSGGPGSGIWKSSDGGDTWANISHSEGLPKGIWGISTLAISAANSDVIYAMIENENGGLYRSNDAGKTWKLVNGDRSIRQRAWYFSRLCVNPENPEEIYALNVSLHRSKDGGKSFQSVSVHHGDNHDMWINPLHPEFIALANDGGGQISKDGGTHWSEQNNQPTAQFYRVQTDNSEPFRIYAAQQDNSTIRIPHRTESHAIGLTDWEPTAGGESGHIAIDPLDPDIVYGGSYGGYLSRYDHKRNLSRNVHVWPDNPLGHGAQDLKYRFQWNFPLFFSPHNPKRLYTASNHLHVTENEGQHWETISPDLTRNDSTKLKPSGGPITKDNTSVEYYCTLFAAAESPRKKDLLWVGSDDGLVHVSEDGGQHWNNVTPVGLPEWTMINSIEPDPHRDGGCYVAATAYKNGDFKPYLFKTSDYGKTWTSIVTGIPSEHFTRVLRADPVQAGLLYAGTEYGFFVSTNDGANWQSFQLNLPLVPITDLKVKNEFLIASTQGRSLWIIDDLGPLRQLVGIPKKSKHVIFKPKAAIRTDGNGNKQIYSGTNHPANPVAVFYQDTIGPRDTISFYCIQDSGDTLKKWSNFENIEGYEFLKLKSGSNRLEFNLREKPAKSFDGMVLWWAGLQAPKPKPGNYRLLVKGMDYVDTTILTVSTNPLYDVSEEAVKSQYTFIKKIRDRIDESHKAIIQMRGIRKQLNEFCEQIASDSTTAELLKYKDRIDSALVNIEGELYQTKSKSNQDPINYPIKLTNKLAHLIALYEHGQYPPTDQAEQYLKEIDNLIEIQLNAYHSILQNELKQFNFMLRHQEMDFIRPFNVK